MSVVSELLSINQILLTGMHRTFSEMLQLPNAIKNKIIGCIVDENRLGGAEGYFKWATQ